MVIRVISETRLNVDTSAVMAERDRELCLKRSRLLTRRTFGEIRRHRHAMADHRPALPGLVDHLNLIP